MTARWRNDVALVAAFLRSGVSRAVLVAFATALVSGLLLVVVTVLIFSGSPHQPEALANLVRDPGLRGGYLFGLLLICIAPLTLLRQVVRLGTAAREQRLASLRLAGATAKDVRRWGALEVGLPALTGGLLGYPVFLALRSLFGGLHTGTTNGFRAGYGPFADELRLIPTTVEPTWWHLLGVTALVGAAGAIAGATATRGLSISPVGVSRKAPRSAPRPWGVSLLLAAVAVVGLSVGRLPDGSGTVLGIIAVALLILGLLALTPWIAYRVGRAVAARTSRPHVLLAARRLAADPRPAARAGAAVGTIGMVAGAGGALLSELPSTSGGQGFGSVEPMYTVPLVLIAGVLVVALALVVLSLTVHAVESLVDRKRATASLAALGATHADLLRVQRWEIGLVAIPVTALGVLLGSVPYAVLLAPVGPYAWIPVAVDVSTVTLAWLGVLTSARLARRWIVHTADPTNLRTA